MIRKIKQKWRRLCSILHQKRGFTLVEMVAGMSISAILLLSIAVVMPNIHLNYVNSIELSYSRIMANNIADAIKNQLAFGYVESCDSQKIVYVTEYSLSDDGKTTINFNDPNPIIVGLTYDKNYYLGKEARVHITETTAAGETEFRDFVIAVSVKSTQGSSGSEYTLERTVRQFHSK